MIQQQRVTSIPAFVSVRHRAPAAAAVPWWLAGGATGCVAAYQAKGSASLAASYVNLANPGTYDAAPGVAPTWSAATGWTFNGTTQYLTTGIIPAAVTWSFLARYSDAVMTNGRTYGIAGSYHISGDAHRFVLYAGSGDNPNRTAVGNDGYFSMSTLETAGVLGFAGSTGYFNGLTVGTITPNITRSIKGIYVGAMNTNGTAGGFFKGSFQALAVWNETLTAQQVAAVSAAMAAL